MGVADEHNANAKVHSLQHSKKNAEVHKSVKHSDTLSSYREFRRACSNACHKYDEASSVLRRSDYAKRASRGARSLAMDAVQCHQIYHRAVYYARAVLILAITGTGEMFLFVYLYAVIFRFVVKMQFLFNNLL